MALAGSEVTVQTRINLYSMHAPLGQNNYSSQVFSGVLSHGKVMEVVSSCTDDVAYYLR
jgi:hypothetical protein